MRSLLAASVLCLPAIVSAQAVHSGLHLVASVDAPAFAFQASAVKAVSPRVFTGIIAPIRLTAVQLAPSVAAVHPKGEVVVEYTVDTAGKPENVHVVKPLETNTDQAVVEAVKRVRYTPGQLDGQTIAVPVTLHVAVN